MSWRVRITDWAGSSSRARRLAYRIGQASAPALRICADARWRSERWSRLRYGGAHGQGSTLSFPDRYPVLFAECARRLAGLPGPRVLSYGCSTGEEAASLAARMPHAAVVGVDLNRWCLRRCRARRLGRRVAFLHRRSAAFAAAAPFDAVFCMAVLQRGENGAAGVTYVARGFTFTRFEAELAFIDARLKVGGLLFIDHSDFAFEAAQVSARYAAVSFPGSCRLRRRPLFGPDGRLVALEAERDRCFVKLAA